MSRTQLPRVVAVTAATLLGAGTAYLATSTLQGDAAQPSGYAVPASAAPTWSPQPDAVPGPPPAAGPAARTPTDLPPAGAVAPPGPTRLTVARLALDMPVTPQGVDGQGQMALPDNPAEAGWYQFAAAPASDSGAVVLAAHLDSRAYGIGPFARLAAVREGDHVTVTAGGATWTYRVSAVQRQMKTAVDLAQLFSRDGPPRLHLVTCTGRYNRLSGYEANLVVVAERVPAP